MATYVLTAQSLTSEHTMAEYGANGRVEYLSEHEANARGAEWIALLNRETPTADWTLVVEQLG